MILDNNNYAIRAEHYKKRNTIKCFIIVFFLFYFLFIIIVIIMFILNTYQRK